CTITGSILVPAQSYLLPGDTAEAVPSPTRGLNLSGQLSGSGSLVVVQGRTNLPVAILGPSNTFSGQWIVRQGLLFAPVSNSLGTNSITVDPNYPVAFLQTFTNITGPAILEPSYNLV